MDAYLSKVCSHTSAKYRGILSESMAACFSKAATAIFLDKTLPQFYNWSLNVFQQSCGAVNLHLENSYDDEHLVAA